MSIRLITMGGTIDKDYFDALSEYQVVDSILSKEIQDIGVPIKLDTLSVCKKDSLEITEDDRTRLCDAIASAAETHFLVSHGTDTLAETARFLESSDALRGRHVVLFGAMRPLRFKDTDALFNAAFALGVLRCSDPGVYVAMSGQVFKPGEVAKNRDAGRFESK